MNQIIKDETFRDHLAASRTIFASERTLLGYIRTSMTIILVAISLMKLFDVLWINVLGWMMIPAAIGLFIIGYVRHRQRKVVILTEEHKVNGDGPFKKVKKVTVKAQEEF